MLLNSLRTRLVLAYAFLIVVGFGILAVLASRQIAVTAESDFEDQIGNEVSLLAAAMAEPIDGFLEDEMSRKMTLRNSLRNLLSKHKLASR